MPALCLVRKPTLSPPLVTLSLSLRLPPLVLGLPIWPFPANYKTLTAPIPDHLASRLSFSSATTPTPEHSSSLPTPWPSTFSPPSSSSAPRRSVAPSPPPTTLSPLPSEWLPGPLWPFSLTSSPPFSAHPLLSSVKTPLLDASPDPLGWSVSLCVLAQRTCSRARMLYRRHPRRAHFHWRLRLSRV